MPYCCPQFQQLLTTSLDFNFFAHTLFHIVGVSCRDSLLKSLVIRCQTAIVENWNGLWPVKETTLGWFIWKWEGPIPCVICWNSIPPQWQLYWNGDALGNSGQMPDGFKLRRLNTESTCFCSKTNLTLDCTLLHVRGSSIDFLKQSFSNAFKSELLPAAFRSSWFGMFWPCKLHEITTNATKLANVLQIWFVDPVRSKTTLLGNQLFRGIAWYCNFLHHGNLCGAH